MKSYILVGVTSVLLSLAGVFMYIRLHNGSGSCCVTKGCVNCTCPCTTKNNVLRWVRDPNLGTYYYGWYEQDGSAFNYVASAARNHRMGNAADTLVPVHKWVQVN